MFFHYPAVGGNSWLSVTGSFLSLTMKPKYTKNDSYSQGREMQTDHKGQAEIPKQTRYKALSGFSSPMRVGGGLDQYFYWGGQSLGEPFSLLTQIYLWEACSRENRYYIYHVIPVVGRWFNKFYWDEEAEQMGRWTREKESITCWKCMPVPLTCLNAPLMCTNLFSLLSFHLLDLIKPLVPLPVTLFLELLLQLPISDSVLQEKAQHLCKWWYWGLSQGSIS